MARFGRTQPFLPKIKRPDLGPVYFDNASNSTYQAALSTYNWTHVVGTNNNRFIIVGVSVFAAGSVSSITVGALSLTFLRSDTNGVYRSELWYGVAPATGSNTVTVNLSGSLTSIAGATSYWNVDQSAPIDANNGANGTNTPASGSVTTVTANDRVFGNLAAQTTSGISDQIGQANRYVNQGALGTGAGAEKGTIVTAGSTTLQWNGLGALDSWAVSFAGIKASGGNTTTTQTITGVARIQKSVTQTITGVGRIQKSVSQTITGVSRIQKNVSQTTTGVARIQKTVDPWLGLFFGTARIQKSATKTTTGVARIQQDVSQTIAGVAKITANTTKTTNGVTRIQNSATQTSTGTARIQKSNTQTTTGVGRIQKTITSTLAGVARVQKSVLQTITGVSRIQNSASQTTTGVAAITSETTQNITGTGRITALATKTTTGIARIQKNTTKTTTGVANISNSTITTQTITGVANIYSPYVNQTITGVARIERPGWYQDNPTPFKGSASSTWYTDNPQSFKTNASSAWYEDASDEWKTEDF